MGFAIVTAAKFTISLLNTRIDAADMSNAVYDRALNFERCTEAKVFVVAGGNEGKYGATYRIENT